MTLFITRVGPIAINRAILRLIFDQRTNVIAFKFVSAGKKFQLNHENKSFNLSAQAFDQRYWRQYKSGSVTREELERIHRRKTGALIRAAARCGTMIAGANETDLDAVTEYANNLGLLFQITDDLLDVTATAEDLGKTPGKDARSRKATYPAVFGIAATQEQSKAIHHATCSALDRTDSPTNLLRSIADFVLGRQA